MEPNNTNQSQPGFDLPQTAPQEVPGVNPNAPQAQPYPEVNQQTEAHNMELPAAAAPMPQMQQASQGVAPMPTAIPLAQPYVPATQPPVAMPSDELAAEDSDLIEKAWVEKAKAIVEQTKDDPHRQNNELNKVKASYIKKRYQKDIKLNEESHA